MAKSLRASESIIQDLLVGNPVPPPEGYEDLFVYWEVFSSYIQDRSFKEAVPVQLKQNVLDYLRAIEALMVEKATKNQMFAQKLMTLELFPLVFELPPALPEVMPAPASGLAPPLPPEEEMEGLPLEQEDMTLIAQDTMHQAALEHV